MKFQKQPMMRKVLLSLAPIFIHSLWLYGFRTVAVIVVTFIVGIVTEHLFERKKPGGKVSEAVLVTCSLYALSMPPAVPLWIVAVGIAFAVFMAKEVYGGFARNVFNPAISGRLFVYISFAAVMGKSFAPSGSFGTLGGRFWTGILVGQPDVITSATPLGVMRSGGSVDIVSLLTGFREGSIGEGSIILIAIAAIYLIATKTASWRIIVSTLLGALITAAAFLYGGVPNALPLESLLSGSLIFMIVFMATDPVTAPKRTLSLILYGLMIGSVTIVIRQFSAFPELRDLEKKWPRFHFVAALSEPKSDEKWEGDVGLITDVLDKYFKEKIGTAVTCEGYLCGGPGMIDACIRVMNKNGVTEDKIYFDKFA